MGGPSCRAHPCPKACQSAAQSPCLLAVLSCAMHGQGRDGTAAGGWLHAFGFSTAFVVITPAHLYRDNFLSQSLACYISRHQELYSFRSLALLLSHSLPATRTFGFLRTSNAFPGRLRAAFDSKLTRQPAYWGFGIWAAVDSRFAQTSLLDRNLWPRRNPRTRRNRSGWTQQPESY